MKKEIVHQATVSSEGRTENCVGLTANTFKERSWEPIANINKTDYSTKSQKRKTRLRPRLRQKINPPNHVHFILLSLVLRLPSRHETHL